MKHKLLALLAAGLLGASAAYAGTVKITPTPNQSGTGGPFIAVVSDMGTYNTFCLEVPESISYNVPYEYTLGSAATNGGNGGGNPDPLGAGSVWLMTKYANSVLGLTVAEAFDMQQAFWMLEQEIAWNALNPYIAEVVAALGSQAAALADALDLGSVRVINPYLLTSVNGQEVRSPRQSLIIYVPDSGTTLILLGLGLGLVGLVSRRVRS